MDWLLNTKIAHRGLHNKDRAENSLSAYSAAIENGYNIEIDVRLTKDNKVVVFHDPSLKRVCGVNKKVNSLTYNQIKNFKLKNTEDVIPLFSDFLKFINGRTGLLIELKMGLAGNRKLTDLVMQELKDYKGNYALQSFSPYIVKRIMNVYTGIRVGILAKNYKEKFIPRKYANLTYFTKMPDFIAYEVSCLPYEYITRYREQGTKVLTWTVNTPEKLARALNNADNIIFEMPAFPNGLPAAKNN